MGTTDGNGQAPLGDSDVGLVHDYLLVMRGAERTFAQIAACWLEAPIYTTLYSEAGTRRRFAGRDVHTSPLQWLHPGQSTFRGLLPLYPWAAGHLRVQRHRLVISSSSAFAHGVRPAPGAVHICYCHCPFRYAWREYDRALRESRPLLRFALRATLDRIRRWDREAAQRVTRYVANSAWTQQQIWDIYGRESSIVHPPVDVERFSIGDPEDFFLVVSELVSHKHVDIAVQAALRAGVPIKVIGDGPERPRLESVNPNAEFLGRVTDKQAKALYSRARAVVVPSVEEFGIVAVEAQAAGRPVVASDAGGARETVIDGETGVLVPENDADALAECLRETSFGDFVPAAARENAERFSVRRFREAFSSEVARIAGVSGVRQPA